MTAAVVFKNVDIIFGNKPQAAIAMVDLPTDASQDKRHRLPDPTLRHFPPGKKPWPWVGVISPQVVPSGSAIGSDDPL